MGSMGPARENLGYRSNSNTLNEQKQLNQQFQLPPRRPQSPQQQHQQHQQQQQQQQQQQLPSQSHLQQPPPQYHPQAQTQPQPQSLPPFQAQSQYQPSNQTIQGQGYPMHMPYQQYNNGSPYPGNYNSVWSQQQPNQYQSPNPYVRDNWTQPSRNQFHHTQSHSSWNVTPSQTLPNSLPSNYSLHSWNSGSLPRHNCYAATQSRYFGNFQQNMPSGLHNPTYQHGQQVQQAQQGYLAEPNTPNYWGRMNTMNRNYNYSGYTPQNTWTPNGSSWSNAALNAGYNGIYSNANNRNYPIPGQQENLARGTSRTSVRPTASRTSTMPGVNGAPSGNTNFPRS